MFSKTYTTLFAILFSFAIISCDLSTDFEEQDAAAAIIAAEFFDGNTGEALADLQVTVSAEFEDSGNLFEQGTVETDEDGSFEAAISSSQETVITQLEFTVTYNDQVYTFTEEVDVLVQFEEPYDRIDLTFNIEADQTPDPE
ncbi:MAG: hypothetical protein JJU46_10280 [Balneolaceae bacterium]|nr:hypothetical protein [Balneolaceae bacterium]MCH8547722.1 hypothetical protein [Balneolaceae bacterium]